jgi:5'(3')-deoxyribonucleotidase
MKKTAKNLLVSRIYGRGRGWAFTPNDFIKDFKSWEIRNSLEDLTNEGRIRRILRGLYDYPIYSYLLNKTVAPDMEQVANALARKFSWRIQPTGDTALNYLNLSTQVMGNYIYLSDGPSKKYDILGQSLEFKHTTLKEATLQYKTAALVVQAIKAVGEEKITSEFLEKLKNKFKKEEWQQIKKDSIKAPLWVYNLISEIADFKENI